MQPVDETAVGKAVVFGCCLDPYDPKTPKISFSGSPVPVGILERTLNSLFGCPVIMAPRSPIAFGQL
jgi:hypothetical protein